MKTQRLLALCLIALGAGGCSFHPLYGNYGPAGQMSGTLSSIYVEPVSDRLGYELRNTLIDLLDSTGGPGKATYRLQLTFAETSQGIAAQNEPIGALTETVITRYNDRLTVTYSLTDAKGTVITSGTETGLSAYNVVASPYATLGGQQDADKRSVDDIAERIRMDLAIYFVRASKKK